MRRDIAKVIVERPRINSRYGQPKGRRDNIPLDDRPTHEGIKKQKGGTKDLNENLAPLRRFIEKQVNRPWNKVFSEINEYIKPGNTVQEHVLGHLRNFINLKVVKVPLSEKYPCGLRGSSGRFGGLTAIYAGELYVDPDDGIIKRARQRVFTPAKRPSRRQLIQRSDRIYCKHKGIWYSVKCGTFKLESYQKMVESNLSFSKKTFSHVRTFQRFVIDDARLDALSDDFLGIVKADESLNLERLYGGKNVYGIHGTRKQVGRAELKHLGLKNEDLSDEGL